MREEGGHGGVPVVFVFSRVSRAAGPELLPSTTPSPTPSASPGAQRHGAHHLWTEPLTPRAKQAFPPLSCCCWSCYSDAKLTSAAVCQHHTVDHGCLVTGSSREHEVPALILFLKAGGALWDTLRFQMNLRIFKNFHKTCHWVVGGDRIEPGHRLV